MHCPYCRNTDTRVLDSRVADDGSSIRRRRTCPVDNGGCGKRFSTVEKMQLTVLKRSGATEPFARDKAISGVRKACKGRPVSEDQLACLGQEVEDALRGEGWAEVPTQEVGLAILGPLRELDEVAYLRFASVYRAFESADDFEAEIARLRGGCARLRPRPPQPSPKCRCSMTRWYQPAVSPQTARHVVGKLRAGHTTSQPVIQPVRREEET